MTDETPYAEPDAAIETVLVAHGAPSDPEPQEEAIRALAAEVGALLPGARILGATLAKPGALEAALGACAAPSVYPFFMAQGWFTGTVVPREMEKAGRPGARVLTPFGTDPGITDLVLRAALDGARAAGIVPGDATLFLAAHGSAVSRGSASATADLVRRLAAGPFARVVSGFVEEAPYLVDTARAIEGPALCLPLFALTAGHVEDDIPQALAEANFGGPLLPAVGAHPGTPAMIAAAIAREMTGAPA